MFYNHSEIILNEIKHPKILIMIKVLEQLYLINVKLVIITYL